MPQDEKREAFTKALTIPSQDVPPSADQTQTKNPDTQHLKKRFFFQHRLIHFNINCTRFS